MADHIRCIFSFLVISHIFLSQSLPWSAAEGLVVDQSHKAIAHYYPYRGGQLTVADNEVGAFHTRKLGIHIRRRARFTPRGGRSRSFSSRTQISSFHVIGSVLGYCVFVWFLHGLACGSIEASADACYN